MTVFTNRRAANRLRDRVQAKLHAAGQVDQARAAWERAWTSRRAGLQVRDTARARLTMLVAIDAGRSIAEAEEAARSELAKEPQA